MASDKGNSSEREQRLNEVIAAYLEAVESGKAPDREDWLARHPEFADDLRALFVAQNRFAALRPPQLLTLRKTKSHSVAGG